MLLILLRIFENATHVCSPNPTHVAGWILKIVSNIAWKSSSERPQASWPGSAQNIATDIGCRATLPTETSGRLFEPFGQVSRVFPTSLRTIGDAIIPRQCKDTCKRKAGIKFLLNLKCERCTLRHLAYIIDMHHLTWHPHPLRPFQYVQPHGDTSCFPMGFLCCCLMTWTNQNQWHLQ